MNDVIYGQNVLVQFQRDSEWQDWVCAEDCTLSFNAEKKEVKTTGDGPFRRTRTQKLSWQLDLSGVTKVNTTVQFGPIDIIDALLAMVSIPCQIIFEDTDTGNLVLYTGDVDAQTSSLTGPAGDFSSQTHSLVGNGPIAK